MERSMSDRTYTFLHPFSYFPLDVQIIILTMMITDDTDDELFLFFRQLLLAINCGFELSIISHIFSRYNRTVNENDRLTCHMFENKNPLHILGEVKSHLAAGKLSIDRVTFDNGFGRGEWVGYVKEILNCDLRDELVATLLPHLVEKGYTEDGATGSKSIISPNLVVPILNKSVTLKVILDNTLCVEPSFDLICRILRSCSGDIIESLLEMLTRLDSNVVHSALSSQYDYRSTALNELLKSKITADEKSYFLRKILDLFGRCALGGQRVHGLLCELARLGYVGCMLDVYKLVDPLMIRSITFSFLPDCISFYKPSWVHTKKVLDSKNPGYNFAYFKHVVEYCERFKGEINIRTIITGIRGDCAFSYIVRYIMRECTNIIEWQCVLSHMLDWFGTDVLLTVEQIRSEMSKLCNTSPHLAYKMFNIFTCFKCEQFRVKDCCV